MAERLTDIRKKKIIADYVQLENYSAVARMNGVSHHTVKRVVLEDTEISAKLQRKKRKTPPIFSHIWRVNVKMFAAFYGYAWTN